MKAGERPFKSIMLTAPVDRVLKLVNNHLTRLLLSEKVAVCLDNRQIRQQMLPNRRVSEALCMRFNPQSRRRVRNNDCCVPEETW